MVQQHKNKVPDKKAAKKTVRVKKVGDMKKCSQPWKHPKNSDEKWNAPKKTMVKIPKGFSWKKQNKKNQDILSFNVKKIKKLVLIRNFSFSS